MSSPSPSNCSGFDVLDARRQAPSKHGWYWLKNQHGWHIILVREVGAQWVGLDPYTGKEHPLHFPNDEHWDRAEWYDEVLPPQSQNA